MSLLPITEDNINIVIGIITASATVLTVFIVPFIKWIKKRRIKLQEKIKKEEDRDQTLKDLYAKIVAIEEKNTQIDTMKETLDKFVVDYEEFTTQNLKYIINDAFFGYSKIQEIPDDVLTNACECCDIYINKKHRNHEIRPRCVLLWEERERRAVDKEVHNE